MIKDGHDRRKELDIGAALRVGDEATNWPKKKKPPIVSW